MIIKYLFEYYFIQKEERKRREVEAAAAVQIREKENAQKKVSEKTKTNINLLDSEWNTMQSILKSQSCSDPLNGLESSWSGIGSNLKSSNKGYPITSRMDKNTHINKKEIDEADKLLEDVFKPVLKNSLFGFQNIQSI